jgi:hypothetical protein
MSITVTATSSGAGSANGILLAVRVINNGSLTQNGASTNSTAVTTPQLAITPTASGSWVYGVIGTGAAGTAFSSIDGNTTSIFNANVVSGSNWGVYRSTSGTTTSSTTYGWTLPTETAGNYYTACAEILSNGTISEDASTPAIASTSSALTITTASFTPPASSILIAAVSAQWSGTGAVSLALSDSANAYSWSLLSGTGITNLTSIWAGIPVNTSGALRILPGPSWLDHFKQGMSKTKTTTRIQSPSTSRISTSYV